MPLSLSEPFILSNVIPVPGGGGGAVMLNAALVAPVKPEAVACSVYPVPALSMLRFEKAATPLAVVTVFVPESVPPLGFVPRAIVTGPVKLASVLPASS